MAIEDTAALRAALTTSLVLDNGAGVPTFTRPSTIDVTNSEGNTLTVPANVAAFEGARLVENIATANSGTFNTGNYEVLNLTITGPNEVTASATGTNTIRPDNATGHYETYTAGRTYASTYRVQSVEVQFVQLITNVGMMGSQQFVNFDVVNGTVETSSALITGFIEDFGGGEYRCSAVFTAVNTATTANALVLIPAATSAFRAAYGTGGDRLNIFGYMMEDITDKIVAEPSEYVSKGVLSAPFHGAGLDGFKWFDTQEDGTPVTDTNLQGLVGDANTTLTYQTASNISDTAGAISAKIQVANWAAPVGNIGSATTGLTLSAANSGVQALDGTNTANGPTGTPTGRVQMAIGWSGSTLKAASGTIGTAGSYDGSLNLTNILVDVQGNTRDLNIWTTALTDNELIEAGGGTAPSGVLVESAVGTATLSGLGSDVIFSTVVDATPGQVSVAGVNGSVSIDQVIDGSVASISVQAVSGSVIQAITFDSNVGSVSVSGLNFELVQGNLITTSVGSVAVQGFNSDITIPANIIINANVATLDVTGQPGSVSLGTIISGQVGAISVTGQPGSVSLGTTISGQVGAVNVSGVKGEVILGSNIQVDASVGSVTVAGLGFGLVLPFTFNCGVGSVAVSGVDASITHGLLINAETNLLEIHGISSSISEQTLVNSELGTLQIQGIDATITLQTSDPVAVSVSIELTIAEPAVHLTSNEQGINLTG